MRLNPPSSPALQRQKKIFFPLQNQNSVSTKQLLMTPTLISIFPASGPHFSSCPHIRCHPAGVFTVKTTPSCRGAVQGCGPRVGAGGCGCRWVCTRQPPRQLPAGGCPRSRPAFGAAKAARTSTAATGASSLLAQNTAHGKDGAFPPRPRTIQPRGRASHKADSSTAPARSGFIHPLLCCRRAVDSQRRSPPFPRTLPPRSPPYPLADAGERSRSPRAAAGCSRWQAAAVPLPAAEPSREGGSSGAARSGGGGGRWWGWWCWAGSAARSVPPCCLRGHGRALPPARTKGPARGRPAPKSSWLPGLGTAGSWVGGWKGSAETPPGCLQPLALMP